MNRNRTAEIVMSQSTVFSRSITHTSCATHNALTTSRVETSNRKVKQWQENLNLLARAKMM